MHTEELMQTAIQWLQERPTLAREQLGNPLFSLKRAQDEIDELIEAIQQNPDPDNIKQELADVFNFLSCAEWIILQQFGLTSQEVADEAREKYLVRNHVKYPAEGYQNGVPAYVQLKRDANRWAFASTYEGADPTQIIAGERY